MTYIVHKKVCTKYYTQNINRVYFLPLFYILNLSNNCCRRLLSVSETNANCPFILTTYSSIHHCCFNGTNSTCDGRAIKIKILHLHCDICNLFDSTANNCSLRKVDDRTSVSIFGKQTVLPSLSFSLQ